MGERIEDHRQIDLEEAIAMKGGRPYSPPTVAKVVTTLQMYEPLERVLNGAYAQAAFGKGKERHANEKPFLQQPLMEIVRSHGIGFATGQAAKKGQEAIGMISRGENDAAKKELLGAIVYLAAACLYIEETQGSPVDIKSQGE
jgi:hypothetical protein